MSLGNRQIFTVPIVLYHHQQKVATRRFLPLPNSTVIDDLTLTFETTAKVLYSVDFVITVRHVAVKAARKRSTKTPTQLLCHGRR
jgi:hypothetical protein